MNDSFSSAVLRSHYAWRILAACCVIQFAGCGLYSNSIGIFMPWICSDMGFTTAQYSLSLTVGNLTMMVALPLAGRLLAKYPARILITLCVTLCALSLGLSAFFTQLWQWYVAAAVRGFSGAFFFMMMSSLLLNEWFHTKASFAVGLAMAFSGVGGAVIAPLGNLLITKAGWRWACALLAGGSLILMLPCTLRLHDRPGDLGLAAYGAQAVKASSRSPEVCSLPSSKGLLPRLLFCSALISLPIVFNLHFTQFSLSLGASTAVGAFMGSCCMVGNICGKLFLGWLGDVVSIRRSVSIGAAIVLLGIAVLLFQGAILSLYFGAFFFGVCMSLTAVAIPMLSRDLYDAEGYRHVLPLCSTATAAVSALGTGLAGYLYDLTGSYRSFLMLCMGSYLFLLPYLSLLYRKFASTLP